MTKSVISTLWLFHTDFFREINSWNNFISKKVAFTKFLFRKCESMYINYQNIHSAALWTKLWFTCYHEKCWFHEFSQKNRQDDAKIWVLTYMNRGRTSFSSFELSLFFGFAFLFPNTCYQCWQYFWDKTKQMTSSSSKGWWLFTKIIGQ